MGNIPAGGSAVKLAAWRRYNKLTQQQLAAALGCAQGTVSQLESGARLASPKLVIAIRDLTRGEVQPNDLFDSSMAA